MNKIALLLSVLIFFGCQRNTLTFRDREGGFKTNTFEFDYLEAKVKMDYETDKSKLTAFANLRIRQDSAIWVSLSPGLGVEVMRAMVTKESIQAYDKLKKEYYEYTYAELTKKYGFEVTYALAESVFLGNLLFDPSKKDVNRQEKQYVFVKKAGDYSVTHYVGANSQKLEKLEVIDPKTSNNISVIYGDFHKIQSQIAPRKIKARIEYSDGEKKTTKIDIEYKTTELSTEPLTFPFNVPSKYTRK